MTPETKAEAARTLQGYAQYQNYASHNLMAGSTRGIGKTLALYLAQQQRNAARTYRVAREILCELVTDNADRLYTSHRNIEMETVIHIAAMRAGMLDY